MAITYYDSVADQIKSDDLYFVMAGNDAIKIGRSNDTNRRAAHIQIANHEYVSVLAVLLGKGWQEKVWHRAFLSIKIRGEWFRVNDELRTAIAAASNGKEWIATLLAPMKFIERQVGMNEIADVMKCTEAEANNHMWRNHIADFEETMLDAMPDETRRHQSVREIAGWPKSKHTARKAKLNTSMGLGEVG